jgi:two-component system OmpR family response regulator
MQAAYAINNAFDGEEGHHIAEMTSYDLTILDIMLPKKLGSYSINSWFSSLSDHCHRPG